MNASKTIIECTNTLKKHGSTVLISVYDNGKCMINMKGDSIYEGFEVLYCVMRVIEEVCRVKGIDFKEEFSRYIKKMGNVDMLSIVK